MKAFLRFQLTCLFVSLFPWQVAAQNSEGIAPGSLRSQATTVMEMASLLNRRCSNEMGP